MSHGHALPDGVYIAAHPSDLRVAELSEEYISSGITKARQTEIADEIAQIIRDKVIPFPEDPNGR